MFAAAIDVPVWTDLQGSVTQGVGTTALTYEAYRDTGFKLYFMRRNQSDELNFVFQMPHEWSPTSEVRPHMHVVPMGDPVSAQVLSFVVKYAWSRVGSALPALSGWTTLTATKTVNPGDVYKELVVPLAHITPPAGAVESDILLMQVARDPVPDTYNTVKDHGTAAANLGILSVDVHYQKVKLGTARELPRT